MNFVISPPDVKSVEVTGSNERFPVRRIYCIGRNYIAHIREMGNDEREPPFFFQKSPDALVPSGGDFPYPTQSENVHHEIELVIAIFKSGKGIAVENALNHVYGYSLGLDMTRRDHQNKAKAAGKPWESAKNFDHSAPIGKIRPVSEIGHPNSGRIWLEVNGKTRQNSDLSLQIWNVQESISHLSNLFEVMPGDLIFTGTPGGVGPVSQGDKITGGIEGIGQIKISVV